MNVKRSTLSDMKKLRIAVLFGGRSGEHDVSLMSARSVLAALDAEQYEVIQVGITLDGNWLTGANALDAFEKKDVSSLDSVIPPTEPAARNSLRVARPTKMGDRLETLAAVDVFFPVLHGPFGEDGTMQGLFELADAAYVGAGVAGSSVGMDKGIFKDVMRANNIPIVDSLLVLRSEIENDMNAVIDKVEKMGAYPFFAKPANLGSSVGISKCNSRSDLAEGLMEAARFDRRIVIERGVGNVREIEVSVLGNDEPIASVPGEVIVKHEFYSYEAKYIDENGAAMEIPAKLPPETFKKIQALAIKTFKVLSCEGLGRVDLFLKKNNEPVVNEINTLPGFTSISMYPRLWQASGISYSELIDRLIQLAIERFEKEKKLKTNYAGNE